MSPYRPPLTDRQRVQLLRAELEQVKARERTMCETLTRCQARCTAMEQELRTLRTGRFPHGGTVVVRNHGVARDLPIAIDEWEEMTYPEQNEDL